MSQLTEEQLEVILDACTAMIVEEFVLPLLLGMGTLTAAISKDREMGAAIAEQLKSQAAGCRPAGQAMLLSLATLAAPGSTDRASPAPPASQKDALRAALRVIQGGIHAVPDPSSDPDS